MCFASLEKHAIRAKRFSFVSSISSRFVSTAGLRKCLEIETTKRANHRKPGHNRVKQWSIEPRGYRVSFEARNIELKVKSDHRSKFSNLSNWKEEAWKNQGSVNGIRTRDLRDTGAMLYQLSYEATHWERGQFIEFISSRGVKWCELYMK